jgi:hypothetical protein
VANAIQPVKVTVQSQRAGDTAKHNDRTMYQQGYFNDLAPDDGIPNYHWTKEKFGIDSDEMEHLMYESLYMDKIKQRNETYAANYQWSRVFDLDDEDERAKAVDDFRWKHPPRETLFQVGSMDNPIDREHAKKILIDRGEKMVAEQNENFIVLSYDVHMDEGSPHMHMRYLMLDEEGMPNAEGALKEMGVQPPVPYEQWAKEEDARRQARAEKDPKYEYKPAKATSSARNNRLVTFTRDMREDFELQVESEGISIDTNRTRKRHLTQAQERTKRATKEELDKQQKRLDELDSYFVKHRENRDAKIQAHVNVLKQRLKDGDEETKQRLQYNSLKAKNQGLLEKLKSRDENELGPFYDQEGDEINDEWFATAYAEVEAASFRPSKKEKIRKALEAVEAAISEPEEPSIDVETLEDLQRNYNEAEQARQRAAELAEQRQAEQRASIENAADLEDDADGKDTDGDYGD